MRLAMKSPKSVQGKRSNIRDRIGKLTFEAECETDAMKLSFFALCFSSGNFGNMNQRFQSFCREVMREDARREKRDIKQKEVRRLRLKAEAKKRRERRRDAKKNAN